MPLPFVTVTFAKDFHVDILRTLLADAYNIYPLYVDLEDVGHAGVARSRVYVVVVTKMYRVLANPQDIYEKVARELRLRFFTRPWDYLTASSLEVQCEALEAARLGKKLYQPDQSDLTYLLSAREREVVEKLSRKYEEMFGTPAESDRDLVFFLGDSAEWCTWSATSRKIPTFRRNAGSAKYWFPCEKRLTALTFPVRSPVGQAAGLPVLQAMDVKRASQLAGNAMALQVAGLVQMVALSCFSPVAEVPGPA
ncbi:unnamed protein product [Symbiodinium sp. CCMP2592]|nr:unnamed protein product [Symbiodinium sp. CCMP2592]